MSDLHKCTLKYHSESDEEIGKTKPKKRKQPSKRIWFKFIEFQTADDAIDFVRNLKIWKKITTYKSSIGYKITYRCTAGEYRKNECPAGIYLLFHSGSQIVSLYKTQNDHDNHEDGKRGLSMTAREIVCQLFNDGIRKPNAIIASFQNRGLEEPEKLKLNNFLAKLRQKKWKNEGKIQNVEGNNKSEEPESSHVERQISFPVKLETLSDCESNENENNVIERNVPEEYFPCEVPVNKYNVPELIKIEEVPIEFVDTFAEIKKELMEENINKSSEVSFDCSIKIVNVHSENKFQETEPYKCIKRMPHTKEINLENENPLALSISTKSQTISNSRKDEFHFFV